MLKRAAYQPLTARSSREALALFQRHAETIDVVLLDLQLPAESTPELLEALRALRPDIRVILMSGLPERVALQRLARDGIMGFLCKPFGPKELTRILETVLPGCDPPDAAGAAGGAVLATTLNAGSPTGPPDSLPAREPWHRQAAS
jgi:DNA-binding NtrC family response regulator